MTDLEQVASGTLADLRQLRIEIQIVYDEQVRPNWGSSTPHGFPRTLYGYVMSTFAMIDLVSTLEHGLPSQTSRMRRLLAVRLGVERHAAAVAVQMWRHTLMHTGNPGLVVERRTGVRYQWLLHWWAEIPREQHLSLMPGHDSHSRILGTGLVYMLDDLIAATSSLFADADRDAQVGSVVVNNAEMLALQAVTVRRRQGMHLE